jgi:hypothetical protein
VELNNQQVQPSEHPAGRDLRMQTTVSLVGLAIILYMGGLTGFLRWEEKATTNAEFIRRAQVRNRIYAPVVWLKTHDPSGAIRAVVQWEYRMCHNTSFDPSRLP